MDSTDGKAKLVPRVKRATAVAPPGEVEGRNVRHTELEALKKAHVHDCKGLGYEDAGKNEEALAEYKKGLAIRIKDLAPDHPKVANSYDHMASVYRSQGKNEEALEEYKKSLAINIKAHGAVSREVAMSYQDMAAVLDSQGKFEEALKLCKQGLAIHIMLHGPDHADVAHSYELMEMVHGTKVITEHLATSEGR
jgi:tetratricopeptide (TPR) repeat protein